MLRLHLLYWYSSFCTCETMKTVMTEDKSWLTSQWTRTISSPVVVVVVVVIAAAQYDTLPYTRFVYPQSEGKIRRISERKRNFSHKISVMTLKVFYKNRTHMHFSNFLTYFYLPPFDAETDMFEWQCEHSSNWMKNKYFLLLFLQIWRI